MPGVGPAPAPLETTTQQPVAAALPVDYDERCQSKHAFAWPDCSTGATLPIGIAGILGTAVLGFLDWRKARRTLEVVA